MYQCDYRGWSPCKPPFHDRRRKHPIHKVGRYLHGAKNRFDDTKKYFGLFKAHLPYRERLGVAI
jgi:hypothetical protein